MAAGKFITLEGSEGVGKTTNIEFISSFLEDAGIDCVRTREPGGTPLAEELRELLLAVRDEPVTTLAETLLMFAARAQHVAQLIEPELQAGRWVVCDRFTDATYAYQGGGRGVDAAAIASLEAMVHGGLQPDLTLYLDVAPEVASERIADRSHDRIEREQLAFFDRVRGVYLDRARELDRIVVIDAAAPLEEVQRNIAAALAALVDGARG